MSNTLAAIERVCGEGAVTGLKGKIYVACSKDVATLGAASAGVVTTITMVTDKVFEPFDIAAVRTKNGIESTYEGDKDHGVQMNALTVVLPGITGAKNTILDGMKGCPHIVIYESKGGKKFLLGDLEDGAFAQPSSTLNGETNAYTLVLTAENAYMPHEFDGTVPVT